MIDRVEGKAVRRRHGRMVQRGGPEPKAEPPRADVQLLLRVERDGAAEVPEIRAFFEKFGDRLPAELMRSLDSLSHELTTASV